MPALGIGTMAYMLPVCALLAPCRTGAAAAKDGNLISTNVLRSRGWCQRRSGPDGAPPVQFDHPVGQGPNLGFVM